VKERLTFGGHATVVLDMGGRRLVTDPLLRRRVAGILSAGRSVLRPSDLGAVDAVLISHLHHDHLDLPSLKLIGRDVQIICPAGAEDLLKSHGFERVLPLCAGDSTTVGDASVSAVPADHHCNRTLSKASAEPLGYVIRGGASVYFAGDTDLFDGMREIGGDLDVALLPVWGWGPTLGEGHLDPEEAARAARLLAPRLAVPIHWGLLSPPGGRLLWSRMLEEPPTRFAAALAEGAEGVPVRVMRPRDSLDLAEVAA
jgi:L-ascorbate metabolism protein UlaG (beta-lactamase superfamily)